MDVAEKWHQCGCTLNCCIYLPPGGDVYVYYWNCSVKLFRTTDLFLLLDLSTAILVSGHWKQQNASTVNRKSLSVYNLYNIFDNMSFQFGQQWPISRATWPSLACQILILSHMLHLKMKEIVWVSVAAVISLQCLVSMTQSHPPYVFQSTLLHACSQFTLTRVLLGC